MIKECKEPQPSLIYYRCHQSGHGEHMPSWKRAEGIYCTGSYPYSRQVKALPISLLLMEALVEENKAKELVDMGSLTTVVATQLISERSGESRLVTFDEIEVKC